MERLNHTELEKLTKHRQKLINIILKYSGIVFAMIMAGSFIPLKYLRLFRRISTDSDLSLIQGQGVLATLIVAVTIASMLAVLLVISWDLLPLLKDKREQQKVVLDVEVIEVRYLEGYRNIGPQEILLFFTPQYRYHKKIHIIGEPDFPKLQKGQKIELVITPNALYPLSITPK